MHILSDVGDLVTVPTDSFELCSILLKKIKKNNAVKHSFGLGLVSWGYIKLLFVCVDFIQCSVLNIWLLYCVTGGRWYE
jgi:hypothetical protein